MRHLIVIAITWTITCLVGADSSTAQSTFSISSLDHELLTEAMTARASVSDQVSNTNFMTIIDYRPHSNEPRFYLVDLSDNSTEAFLVAHGKGSDPDHDGFADRFSNTPDSKMSSLGAFVTGETYYGRHGLSLRLHGLDPINDKAEARAIVIHGADYVGPGRRALGRSWGCPALEQDISARVIPLIKDGSFVYIAGPSPDE